MLDFIKKINLWLSKVELEKLDIKILIRQIVENSTHIEYGGILYPLFKDELGGFSFKADGNEYKPIYPLEENMSHNSDNCFQMMVSNFCENYADDIKVRFYNLLPSNLVTTIPEEQLELSQLKVRNSIKEFYIYKS